MSSSKPGGRWRAWLTAPKGLLLLTLIGLTAVAYPVEGPAAPLRVAASVVTACAAELLLRRSERRALEFPESSVLTGFIVAMVISPTAPLAIPMLASAIGIGAKHWLRTARGHVFNPAAVGLLAVAAISTEQSWWGALGDLPAASVLLVLLPGLLIAGKINKLPSALTFTGVYFTLFTAAAFGGDSSSVADVFRQPFTGAVLFFALFMLTDPPTTPARASDQVWFGAIVAAVGFACYMLTTGGVYYLVVGLLAGNGCEAMRRLAGARSRPAAQRVAPAAPPPRVAPPLG